MCRKKCDRNTHTSVHAHARHEWLFSQVGQAHTAWRQGVVYTQAEREDMLGKADRVGVRNKEPNQRSTPSGEPVLHNARCRHQMFPATTSQTMSNRCPCLSCPPPKLSVCVCICHFQEKYMGEVSPQEGGRQKVRAGEGM